MEIETQKKKDELEKLLQINQMFGDKFMELQTPEKEEI